MKDIDFLPPSYREARAERHAQAWRIVVFVGFGGLIGLAALGQYEIRSVVEGESHLVRDQYQSALVQNQRLGAMQQNLAATQSRAELLTYLRHPWPRTQMLDGLFKSLPESITLRRVRIVREPVPGAALVAQPQMSADASSQQSIERLTPEQGDLQRLRREIDPLQTVVLIDGTSDDDTALHVYLSTLAECGLVAKAELTSLENSAHEISHGSSNFSARVVIKPGYGQPGGPTSPPTITPSADLQAARSAEAP